MAPTPGAYDQLNHMSTWDSALGCNISPNTNLPSISQVDTRLANKESLGPSMDNETANTLSAKLQRRLAQNRESARKSRLKKKAYVQQLETCRLKLVQMEQELERVRQQNMSRGLLNTANGLSSAHANSGIVSFEIMYEMWVFKQQKKDGELKEMMQNQVSESELRVSVDSNLNHYYELLEIKANAVKSDVFYFMHGLWRTPIERFFQWLGGPRPSELLCMLMPKFDSLTDAQFKSLSTLKHSCRQAEDALSTGMQKLQQTLAQGITIDITGFESYNAQMTLAMERLEGIENFLNQADHLRQQVLQQVSRTLTTHQAARGLLELGGYFQRLRTLSSLCSSHSHAPEARTNFAMMNPSL